MGHQRWLCPGKLAASLVEILPSSQMGRCAARLANRWLHTNDAQKPMEACVWCMGPASAVAAPVLCASNVNGKAVPPKSLARSACCCILSWLAQLLSCGVIGAAGGIDVPAS